MVLLPDMFELPDIAFDIEFDALPAIFDMLPAVFDIEFDMLPIVFDIVFDIEFDIMFVFVLLAFVAFVLVVSPAQAIPRAPKANTPERAIIFFILLKVSCLLQRLIIHFLQTTKKSQSCPIYLILEQTTI